MSPKFDYVNFLYGVGQEILKTGQNFQKSSRFGVVFA
jgi:hypothetical protein